ncbi:MAG TPA: ribosome biogenesis GTPase Der [Candidatus Saccharimonadales bacterium]|jgi:GTP-binding protein|nr:ribosome biogenesis GTPase Der [Candidatus Saccharimonadales bacterium]
MSQRLPIVAIVGRANVGKSSLFNTLLERREAIVAREAGTTRDSIVAKAEYEGQQFWLVDTAGVKDPEDKFEFTIQEQITQAADSADVIWVVVEADVPITEEDRRVAKMALRSRKPVFLVINKLDKAKGQDLSGFDRLGIKPIFRTSTTQNRGIEQLLDGLIKIIPKASEREDDDRLRIAILGRPNVGKSQLFNTLAKKQQAIVADRAGTTRDVNRAVVRYKGREVELLDTAGIRRSGKIQVGVEKFSVLRALSAINEADVGLLLMDVNELNVQLDQKIAGLVKDAGKGLILVVSKWDAVEGKDAYTRDALAPGIAAHYDFVPWAPLIFTSSVTGQNITKIFDLAFEIDEQRHKRISTSELNKWLRQAVDAHPPAGLKNRLPKLNYMVQETDNPTPAFKIFGSHTRFVHWSYRRYLETRLRKAYGFEGTPVQLWFIEKHATHKHGLSPTKEKV